MSQIYNNGTSNVTATGSAISVVLGYTPSKVEITNRTTLVTTVWYSNLPATNTYVIAANGNKTLDTSSLITSTVNGFTIGAAVGLATEILDYDARR